MGRRAREEVIEPVRVSELPPGTEVMGPSPGDWRIAVRPDGVKLVSPLQWGAERPHDVKGAEAVRAACDDLELPPGGTLARRAGLAFMWHVPGWRVSMGREPDERGVKRQRKPILEARSVPTAYRELWRHIHIGPMVSLQGRTEQAWHYDRRAAYLASLFEPLPCARTERRWRGAEAAQLVVEALSKGRTLHGSAYATVDTSACGDTLTGPLPASADWTWKRDDGAVVTQPRLCWPVAEAVTGTWPLPLLMQAMDNGARLLTVHEMALVEVRPWLEPLGRRLEMDLMHVAPGSPHSTALKAVYQRSWLRTRPYTWVQGEVREDDSVAIAPQENADAMWRRNGVPLGACWLRPDVSWYISLHNILAMMEAIRSNPGVVAAHVDSLHTVDPMPGADDGFDGLAPLGAFRLQHEGPAIFYGIGSYHYEGMERRGGSVASQVSALVEIPDDAELTWTDRPAWSCFDERFSLSGWLMKGAEL